MSARRVATWPVYVLALPAAVSIWAGWVGLGGLTGFGEVALLPGIWDGARINTAITLPIGMEAYAAYALRVWLAPGVPRRARAFARVSALAAFVLGALGQVAFHLMQAAGMTAAPWPVTTAVACLPVGVLALGATLAHLLSEGYDEQDRAEENAQATGTAAQRDVLEPAWQPRTVGYQPPPAAPVGEVPRFAAVPNLSTPAPVARPGTPTQDVPAERPETPQRDVPMGQGGTSRPATAERPETRPARRLAGRPARAKRDVPAKRRGASPLSDEQLAETVREMAAENDRAPTAHQVKTALRVGHARAARVLDLVAATTTPAADPAGNGAARKEGTR